MFLIITALIFIGAWVFYAIMSMEGNMSEQELREVGR